MEQGARYLEQMAAFFGIAKFDCVAAEGLDIGAWRCGADGAGKGEGGRGRKGILNKRNTV